MLYLPNANEVPCYYCDVTGLEECCNCGGFEHTIFELEYFVDWLIQYF